METCQESILRSPDTHSMLMPQIVYDYKLENLSFFV